MAGRLRIGPRSGSCGAEGSLKVDVTVASQDRRLFANELKGRKVNRPFCYFDKGNMAVVGKNYAVLERGRMRTSGFLTWLVWAFVHILSLPQPQNRMRVQRQWLWSYFTGQRSSRLIPEPPRDL